MADIDVDHMTFERKLQLGIVFGEDVPAGQSAGFCKNIPKNLARAAAAEFLGMLLFLFMVITIARFAPAEDVGEAAASTSTISFGFGLSIFVLVYILAEVSGANLNPAVSIGLLVGKRICLERFIVYVIAQALGALAGAGIATTFMDDSSGGFNAIADGVSAVDAFGGEVLCTFLLVLTVFAATDGEMGRKHKHISTLLPLAIGFAVLLDHLVLIPVDGCSINPARSLATAITNNKWDDHWVFWAGPLLGGVLATVVWEVVLRPEQLVTVAKPGSREMITATSV